MALCCKPDADDATENCPGPLDGSVRLQAAAVPRQGSTGRVAGPASAPSDGLTEAFFFFYPVKLVSTCKEHEGCKNKTGSESNGTRGKQNKKLEFFVAEAS